MNQDSGMTLTSLRVDGGMTNNDLLMQLQADLIGMNVGMSIHRFISFDAWLRCRTEHITLVFVASLHF